MTASQLPKKVLILHCCYKIKSGEGVIVNNETKLLRSNGIEVELMTVDNTAGLFKTLLRLIVAPFNPISFYRVYQKIKLFKPQVVHIHNWHFTFSPSIFIAARICKVKVVHSIHNYRLLCPSGTLFYKNAIFLNSINKVFPLKAIQKRVYKESLILTIWLSIITRVHYLLGTWKKIDSIVVNSVFAKKIFLKSYLNLNPDKIIVKPNFNFYNLTSVRLNRNDNYLFVGRISEEKGLLFY